jgi:menaquinol-cytochrome c reductase cytochrome b/c subunit
MATTGDRLSQTTEPNVSTERGTRVLTPPARSRPRTPAENEAGTVQVWPHLIVIEFLGALIITINMVLLATLFNGPFRDLANPDKTPNPSKAPWYFLNLQELLLHMNPALAGVIVPTVALILIAVIPYVDRGTQGMGVWWYSDRGPRVAIFTTVYTIMVTAALIALDNYFPVKANITTALRTADNPQASQNGILSWLTDWFARNIIGGDFSTAAGTQLAHGTATGILVEAIANWIIPIIFLSFFPVLLVFLLKRVFRGIDKTEIIIGLFTGFVILYYTLTFVGTAMRGPSQQLFPPWALPPDTAG